MAVVNPVFEFAGSGEPDVALLAYISCSFQTNALNRRYLTLYLVVQLRKSHPKQLPRSLEWRLP